jgi:hypothetical protein
MLKFSEGSKAVNGKDEVVFLIAVINSLCEVTTPVASGWFRAVHSWQALDEAEKELGFCMVVKSCLASDYDAYCLNNQK